MRPEWEEIMKKAAEQLARDAAKRLFNSCDCVECRVRRMVELPRG